MSAPTSRLPLAARVGAVAWPSFFAAGVATMVFFAVVDPARLATITWPTLDVSRGVGYTLGFFMFWACTLASSLFTSLLLKPRDDVAADDEDA
ncbi:membrane protein [Oleiagrimonas soli]|uniref:Membrane protein n=1 Tax=Oleiagrimonas soli TaxID=1543381 RepID=A0A099CXU1_9GAMM|nr:membrane protein [Oleiagrimonas soli]